MAKKDEAKNSGEEKKKNDQKEKDRGIMSVSLKKMEPKRVGNKLVISIIANVKEGKKPAEDQLVSFHITDSKTIESATTDKDGIAKKDFSLPTGKHEISASLNDGTSATITVDVEEKRQKGPKILSHGSGANGKYALTFQVLDENDNPIPNATLRVMSAGVAFVLITEEGIMDIFSVQQDVLPFDAPRSLNTGVSFDLSETDENGTVKCHIGIFGRELLLRVILLGSSASVWKNLFNSSMARTMLPQR